jgi:hypothetical protein
MPRPSLVHVRIQSRRRDECHHENPARPPGEMKIRQKLLASEPIRQA